MSDRYKLQSGQINFKSLDNTNSYSCIVIKDGVFYNMTDDLKKMLIAAINAPVRAVSTPDIEDMF